MITEFKTNWAFAEKYMPLVVNILKQNAAHIVNVEIASPDEDMKQSTDLKVIVKSGCVAVRVRRSKWTFRDITIRAYNKGSETEIHKLRKGYADWYLYAWEGIDNKFAMWVLLDIGKMRNAGLFDESRSIKMNKDGLTGFVSYSIDEIEKINALVAMGANE